MRLSDFLFPQNIKPSGLWHGYRDTTLVPDITLVPVRSYRGRLSLIYWTFLWLPCLQSRKMIQVLYLYSITQQIMTNKMWSQYLVSYSCRDISFIFSNSKPFHCLFMVFSQIWPKLNTFIGSCVKTRKDIDLKSPGTSPDEIFSAIRVFE